MRPWLAAAFSGLLFGLAPLHGWAGPPLWLLGVGGLGLAVEGRIGADAARGALIGALWYGLSLLWFPTIWSDFDSTGSPWLGWIGLTLLQLTVPCLGLALAGWIHRSRIALPVALALALGAMEGAAGWLQPLPGGLAVYLAPIQPLTWPAALGGAPLLLAVVGGWAGLQATRPLWGVAFLAAWFGIGLLPAPWASDGEPLTVGVVQPNTGGFDGRRASTADARADRLLRLVRAASARAELVVTPEGAWPHDAGPDGSGRRRALLERWGTTPVVLGVSIDDGGGAPTNSLIALDGGRVTSRYDKVDLVPFGERAILGFGRDTFRPGASRTALNLAGVRLAGRICYEDLVPGALRGLGHAELLVTATNDAWLGPGPGSRQHEAASRLAAVVTGRWVVRPASNGRSEVFDPSGRRHLQLPWVDGDAQPDHPGTWGAITVRRRIPLWTGADLGPWLALLMAIAAGTLGVWRRGWSDGSRDSSPAS
jgi:apolipoprotein N-acyltransferase